MVREPRSEDRSYYLQHASLIPNPTVCAAELSTDKQTRGGLQAHSGDGGGNRQKCETCGGHWCPKGFRKDAQCDVHGDPTATPYRITRIPASAQKDLNDRRVKAGKKPLNFPAVSAHGDAGADMDKDECQECNSEDTAAEREKVMAALDAFMAEQDPLDGGT